MKWRKKTFNGMTLVETLIAIFVFTIGMGLVTFLFSQSWSLFQVSFSLGNTQFIASNGVQKIVDTVRNAQRSDNGAYPLLIANENDIVIYSDVDKDGGAEKIRYFFSGSGVIQEIRNSVFAAPPYYPDGYETSQEIIPFVVNASETPLFSFYNNNNEELEESFSLTDIKMIKINVFVDENVHKDPESVNIESFASIRNLSQYESAN